LNGCQGRQVSGDARDRMLRGVDILANAVKVTLGSQGTQCRARQELRRAAHHKGWRVRWQKRSSSRTSSRIWARRWCARSRKRPMTSPATAPPRRRCWRKHRAGRRQVGGCRHESHGSQARHRHCGCRLVKDIERRAKKSAPLPDCPGRYPRRERATQGRQDDCRSHAEGRQRGRDHGRGSQGPRYQRSEIAKACSSTADISRPISITNAEKMVAELEDAFVLLHEKKLSGLQALLPVLEAIVQAGKPLLIVAEDVEGEALAPSSSTSCAVGLKVAAVKAPGFARSAQGDAGRHCRVNRRSAHLGRARHQALKRQHLDAGTGQAGHHREGEDHHRGRRRQEEGHRGARSDRSRRRSRRPLPTTIARSCKSGLPSSPVAWR